MARPRIESDFWNMPCVCGAESSLHLSLRAFCVKNLRLSYLHVRALIIAISMAPSLQGPCHDLRNRHSPHHCSPPPPSAGAKYFDLPQTNPSCLHLHNPLDTPSPSPHYPPLPAMDTRKIGILGGGQVLHRPLDVECSELTVCSWAACSWKLRTASTSRP